MLRERERDCAQAVRSRARTGILSRLLATSSPALHVQRSARIEGVCRLVSAAAPVAAAAQPASCNTPRLPRLAAL